jgi:hypothetical protein
LIAAVFRIDVKSGKVFDNANSEARLLGVNGHVYQATYQDIRSYTNFNNGDFSISAGHSRVGAVVFAVRDHVKITEIKWIAPLVSGPARPWLLSH